MENESQLSEMVESERHFGMEQEHFVDPLEQLNDRLRDWLLGDVVRAYVDGEQLLVETVDLSLSCDLSDGMTCPIGADYSHRLYELVDALRTLRAWYNDFVCPADESRAPFQGGG